jgi:hypothetical protein
MKRLLLVLGLSAIAVAGCLEPHAFGVKQAEHQDSVKTPTVSQRPPTVYPHEVDDTNANAKALALEAEMDFDARSSGAR